MTHNYRCPCGLTFAGMTPSEHRTMTGGPVRCPACGDLPFYKPQGVEPSQPRPPMRALRPDGRYPRRDRP